MVSLTVTVEMDDAMREVGALFDFPFTGVSTFDLPDFPALPKRDGSWNIGLIVGPSGSGKSKTLARYYGAERAIMWNPSKSIVSQVPQARLGAVGLNSIPSWGRPFHVLSNGEQFRANLAARLRDGASVDEFSSVVDRQVAKACSYAVSRFIRAEHLTGVVFASCHNDIIEWLSPDWVLDMRDGSLTERVLLPVRKPAEIKIARCGTDQWRIFAKHHYLSMALNKSAHCFLATWDGEAIGFASALAFPNGNFKNAYREHRTVILPDYQGLGLGVRLSDRVAEHYVAAGCRYFSKTAHPRMGAYREASPLWAATTKNRKRRLDYATNRATKEAKHKDRHINRLCFSHEFIGNDLTN